MEAVLFERQFRTPHSEGYYLKNADGDRIGRVDLHYASDDVFATLVVEIDAGEDDIMDLIEQVDEELVLTAGVPRDDFMVTVYRGKDLGFYSDDYFGDEEDEDGEEEDKDDDKDDEEQEDEEPAHQK